MKLCKIRKKTACEKNLRIYGDAKRNLYPKLVKVQQCSRCARSGRAGYNPSMPYVLIVCKWGAAELLQKKTAPAGIILQGLNRLVFLLETFFPVCWKIINNFSYMSSIPSR